METRDPNDPVAMYLREAASLELLTAAEEAELFRRLGATDDWQGESENAARRVVEAHLRLVVPIAERHAASSGIPLLELIQEGNIGLFNAVKSVREEAQRRVRRLRISVRRGRNLTGSRKIEVAPSQATHLGEGLSTAMRKLGQMKRVWQ